MVGVTSGVVTVWSVPMSSTVRVAFGAALSPCMSEPIGTLVFGAQPQDSTTMQGRCLLV